MRGTDIIQCKYYDNQLKRSRCTGSTGYRNIFVHIVLVEKLRLSIRSENNCYDRRGGSQVMNKSSQGVGIISHDRKLLVEDLVLGEGREP